jgi:16S rRNA processing protein RimM
MSTVVRVVRVAGVTDPGRTGDDRLEVIVGVIGRANGLRGDVGVELRTDEPESRFAPGAVLGIEGSKETLTVAATRDGAGGRLFVRFEQASDRTAAEGLRGRVLTAVVDPSERPGDPEEYYDRQLRGLRVLDASGVEVGVVAAVVHLPSQDLLSVTTSTGERLVPFVSELVPEVDLVAGTCRLAEVTGLLEDLDEV